MMEYFDDDGKPLGVDVFDSISATNNIDDTVAAINALSTIKEQSKWAKPKRDPSEPGNPDNPRSNY